MPSTMRHLPYLLHSYPSFFHAQPSKHLAHTHNVSSPWGQVDPLGQALHVLRMGGTLYCRSEFSAPWALELPHLEDCLMFHFVTSGECWVETDGLERVQLLTGGLALVPRSEGHRISSQPGLRAERLFDLHREQISDRYEILRLGGGTTVTTNMICGAVHFDHPAAQKLIGILPRLICIPPGQLAQQDWITSTLRFMAAEAETLRPGGEAVIMRLSDILVIQAIRSWLEHDPAARSGWLGAIRDCQIGKAIVQIHANPATPWTIEALAKEAGMSRSAFAARFTELVGEPVMRYVAQWKMQAALTALKEGSKIGELAFRLGYQSEAAFSRTFKRNTGASPGAVQKKAGAEIKA